MTALAICVTVVVCVAIAAHTALRLADRHDADIAARVEALEAQSKATAEGVEVAKSLAREANNALNMGRRR